MIRLSSLCIRFFVCEEFSMPFNGANCSPTFRMILDITYLFVYEKEFDNSGGLIVGGGGSVSAGLSPRAGGLVPRDWLAPQGILRRPQFHRFFLSFPQGAWSAGLGTGDYYVSAARLNVPLALRPTVMLIISCPMVAVRVLRFADLYVICCCLTYRIWCFPLLALK